MTDCEKILEELRSHLRSWSVSDERLDGAIYQDMGINGYDFRELMCEIKVRFPLPDFDWNEFADTNEPPDGLSLFGRLKILPRKRLTLQHLAKVITEEQWSEP